MKRTRPLSFEQLETRLTPATWGNPWPDGAHLTLSFAPDGTAAGDRSSALFQTLNGQAPTAVWEREILRAFQTWAARANVNIGLVADGGEPLGAAGRPQGDPRFGDIRVAAYPMSPEVLAITTPFDLLGGTWSGDVRLNSSYRFGVQGSGQVDLFTAMLHEAGHVFGLDDSSDPGSTMYGHYQGPRTALGAGDVTALQALYGARHADAFEGAAGNGTFVTASSLNLLQNSDGALGIQADADVTTLQDADYYRFLAPLNLGGFTVRVQTAGVSLLVPRVTVYDASHRAVGSAVSTDPLGGDLLVNVPHYNPLGTYYVKVESGTNDAFGVGAYHLEVRATPLVGGLLGLVNNTVGAVQTALANTDLQLNSTFLTATLLPPLFSQTNARFDYSFRGNLVDRADVDFFRIQAATPAAGAPNVLTAMVWGTDNNGLTPHLTVYDANQHRVNAQVLVNENGIYTVQIVNAVAGAAYFVKVDAAGAAAGHTTGKYFLGVDFGPNAANLQALTTAALDASRPEVGGTLRVTTTQLFHFVLSAEAAGAANGAGVRLTILDAAGKVVGSLFAGVGQPVSLTVLLAPGAYRFRYDAVVPAGQGVPPLTCTLTGIGISDPIGPQPEDPTENPQPAPAPPDGSAPPPETTVSTDGSNTPPDSSAPPPPAQDNPDSTYTYQDDGSGVPTEDPSGNPYKTS